MRKTLLTALIAMVALAPAILAWPGDAAAGGHHRVIMGILNPTACISSWWHGSPDSSSLDFVTRTNGGCSPGNTSANKQVYWQSRHLSGNAIRLERVQHTGFCTGVQLTAKDGEYLSKLGNYWFVHIQPQISLGSVFWANTNYGWSTKYVGYVLEWETSTCVSETGYDGAHLHRGGDNAKPPIYRNHAIPNPVTNPTDYNNQWVNRYTW
jgi:hypothetical protein